MPMELTVIHPHFAFASFFAAPASMEPCANWHVEHGLDAMSLMVRLRMAIWNRLRAPVEVNWLEGIKITLYPKNELGRIIYVTGKYEPNEFSWLDRFLKPGMNVLDCGAHIGLYSLFCARKVGPRGWVVAVEPSLRELDRLRTNIELDASANIVVMPFALSDTDGKTVMKIAEEPHAGHNTLARFAYEGVQCEREMPVQVRTIDGIVRELGLEKVDVIKLDIEGYELRALRGAIATLEHSRPALLFELSNRHLDVCGTTRSEVFEFLEKFGYTFHAPSQASGEDESISSSELARLESLVALPPKGRQP